MRVGLAQAMTRCVGYTELLDVPEVGTCVEQLLNDDDADVRENASKALDLMGGNGMGALRKERAGA